MSLRLRVSRSHIGEEEKDAVLRVLSGGFLGMGAEVKAFEEELSNFIGRPAVCTATGTAALQLATQAVGIGSGDEVLVQSLTYLASFQAISATGAKPVACDIRRDSAQIDLTDAESRISKNTKAIMPVHYAGDVGDLESIYLFAEKHKLRVIEDAAHAFGSIYENKRVGSAGDIACFSFDGIKNITSGEGGCVVTADESVLQRVRDARLLGVERDTEKRFSGERSWDPDVSSQGWRYHMSDIMAAIGRAQLSKFDKLRIARQSLAKEYAKRLDGIRELSFFHHNYDLVVPHIFVIQLSNHLERNRIIDLLLANGIQTGIHYKPNHSLSLYKDAGADDLPNTDLIYQRLLTLPLHPAMTEHDVGHVCEILIRAVRDEIGA